MKVSKQEMLNRVYDKLFDMVGFSEHHVDVESDIEITDQSVSEDGIYIQILEDGKYREFNLIIQELSEVVCD